MKWTGKFLIIVCCMAVLIGCTSGVKAKVNVVYEIHYPSLIETKNETYNVELHADDPILPHVYLRSSRGTNELFIDYYLICETTAPIRLVSYKTVWHEEEQ